MSLQVQVECQRPVVQNHQHSPCCDHKKKKTKFDVFMNVAEKISAIALGVFSAMISFKLFAPFFILGVCIGVYTHIKNKKEHGEAHSGSSCAQGLLEKLTGVRLPAPISLAANVAVTVCHIEHHDTVFVPIVGVSLGAWAGEQAAHYGSLTCKKMKVHRKPMAMPRLAMPILA